MHKKHLSKITALLLALLLFVTTLSGCTSCDRDDNREMHGQESDPAIEEAGALLTDEQKFDLLMDELFEDWVSSDTLTMNYFLADPYRMDIERPEPTFGEVVSQEMIEESKQETKELSERMDGFNYSLLRDDQQLVYDILRRNIELSEVLEREDDFSYYTGYIRPLNGIQVQLPVLLAEFSFYTEEDIGRYLDLIEDTHRYFNDIIEYERERSRRGFFLNDANVDSVIEQIESYLENRENNLLITVFDDKIDNYEGLSTEQRQQYKQRNKELVLGNVLAAYDTLLDAMKELRGVGARSGGLAALPGGAEYAHALLRLRTGTDKSATDLDFIFEDWIHDTLMSILSKIHGNQEIGNKLSTGTLGQIDESTPMSIIADLRKFMAKDFPPIGETGLNVLEVHESLQEHMSPAFYLTPAVDRFNENVVYVNPSSIHDNLFMFTVMAHESYPGHMYQTVYFFQQSPHPVRIALSNTGYSEGWATYAEMVSYFYTGLDEEEAELLWEFRFFDMFISAYADLGLNVLGWSYDDLISFLEGFNYSDRGYVDRIYNIVTGVPLMQITYIIGIIELLELLEEAQRLQGESFNLMEFHRFYLETGPTPFALMHDRMSAFYKEDAENAQDALEPAA